MGGSPGAFNSCLVTTGLQFTMVVKADYSDEGFLFVNDSIITDSEFNQWLSLSFPYANNGVISQIKDFFYPPPPNSRYLTNPGRINSLISGIPLLLFRSDGNRWGHQLQCFVSLQSLLKRDVQLRIC